MRIRDLYVGTVMSLMCVEKIKTGRTIRRTRSRSKVASCLYKKVLLCIRNGIRDHPHPSARCAVVSPLCVPTHMYLAYKIAHNAWHYDARKVHKCTGSWVCTEDFVSVSLCALARAQMASQWRKGTARWYVTVYFHIGLQRATNVTCIYIT